MRYGTILRTKAEKVEISDVWQEASRELRKFLAEECVAITELEDVIQRLEIKAKLEEETRRRKRREKKLEEEQLRMRMEEETRERILKEVAESEEKKRRESEEIEAKIMEKIMREHPGWRREGEMRGMRCFACGGRNHMARQCPTGFQRKTLISDLLLIRVKSLKEL